MPDPNEIVITEYNDIDSISLNIPDNITNIAINYENNINDINVEYINEIENIILTLGQDSQTIFSVNNLFGDVNLTTFEVISSVSASSGIYSYTINHNLDYSPPIIAIYDINNESVFADVKVLNSNSVKINSVVDLNGYKVVIQR